MNGIKNEMKCLKGIKVRGEIIDKNFKSEY